MSENRPCQEHSQQTGLSSPLRVPVIVGPTAVGKSDLALRLARDLGCDIVSCDSRQVYRFMDIGTAKPTRQEQALVTHWMIDIIDPDRPFSAWEYATRTRSLLGDLFSRGKRPLLCGGTGLYYKALTHGLTQMPPANPVLRTELKKRVQKNGSISIFKELERVDPESARRLHPNDSQRVIRALEIHYGSRGPANNAADRLKPAPEFHYDTIIISRPRERLYECINARVTKMATLGLWDEFLFLRARGYTHSDPGMRSPGYTELFAVEKNQCTFPQALDKVRQNTRRFAKRQLTWFRHQVEGDMYNPDTAAYQILRERFAQLFACNENK